MGLPPKSSRVDSTLARTLVIACLGSLRKDDILDDVNRATLATVLAGATIVLGGSVLLVRGEDTESKLWLRGFSNAECIAPHPDIPEKAWNSRIRWLSGSFRITGQTGVGGEIFIRFADDGLVRRITTYHDYEYPSDVRLDLSTRRLWIATKGLRGGISAVAHLYLYDLESRIGTSIEVDPDHVPTPCSTKAADRANQER